MPWVTKNSSEQYPDAPRAEAEQKNAYDQYSRSYTKSEKVANWWHYHWYIVVIAAVAVAGLVWIVRDVVCRTIPDVQVGYVAKRDLPVDTAQALTAALEEFCTDLNGDGKVVVQLDSYTVDFEDANENTDAYNQMAGVIKLDGELTGGTTYIFLLEDPYGFEEDTQILQFLDGTVDAEPGNTDPNLWPQMVYRWSDCPVLTALELGDYNGETLMDTKIGSSQDLLAGLYVARRGVWDEKKADNYAAGRALWDVITAGAVPMAQGVQ